MSHTTTVKGVSIVDPKAIKRAVKRLQKQGVAIQLVENATPRMYYRSQEKEVGTCEYVLKLERSRYDVGLKLDRKTKSYEVILDLWAGSIKGQLGAKGVVPSDAAEAEVAISQFRQAYGFAVVASDLEMQGYTVTEKMAEDGSLTIIADDHSGSEAAMEMM